MLYTPHTNMYSVGGGAKWGGMLCIRECIVGKYAYTPHTNTYSVRGGPKWEDMFSIRDCIVGKYALHPAHKYVWCWGVQNGEVCLALRSVWWGGMLYTPHTNMYSMWEVCLALGSA